MAKTGIVRSVGLWITICLPIAALFDCLIFCQSNQTSLRGRVVVVGDVQLPQGMEGSPGVMTVHLRTSSRNLVQSLTLRGGTSFSFMGLRRGLYIVEVECPGFEIGSSSVEVPGFLGPDQVRVNVRLGDRISDDSLPPERESSTVSVRELSVSKEASSLLKGAEKEDSKDNPEKATELLKKALEIDPEIYQAYNNLAVQYVRLGLIGEAVQMLLRSIGLYPDDSTTFRNLAELLILQGALDEALMALERSQDLDPGHPKGLMLFGEVYMRYEQYELALDYFERASEVSDETHSFLGMGQCYAVLGRLTEALREFKRFVEEHPEDHRIEATHQVIAQLERDLKIDSP